MWILQKVQAGAESLPVQINHLIRKNKEEISAKTSIFNKLHSNVLTPDKIPDFFLPPKLTKRCLMADAEKISRCLNEEKKSPSFAKTSLSRPGAPQPLRASINKSTVALNKLNPIPYSLKCYESGLFESPNTRRKESLFHSTLTNYTLERIDHQNTQTVLQSSAEDSQHWERHALYWLLPLLNTSTNQKRGFHHLWRATSARCS